MPKNATIQGTVTDEAGNPPGSVTMTLDGYSTTTDANGLYVFVDVPAKDYTMTVSAIGYQTKSVSVAASSGGTVAVDVTLTLAP